MVGAILSGLETTKHAPPSVSSHNWRDIERGMRRVDSLELKKIARLYSLPTTYFLDENADADVGEHALAGLPRALAGLTDGDVAEVLEYAKYLRFKRIAEKSAADADGES